MDGTVIKNSKNPIRKRIKIHLAIKLTIICIFCMLFAPEADATELDQLVLTIKQVLSGVSTSGSSDSQTFTYRLTPITEDSPMPDSSSQEGYTFSITGTDIAQTDPITFRFPGTYIYELACEASANTCHNCSHSVYTIKVYVADNIIPNVVIYNSDRVKVEEMEYTHNMMLLPSDPGAMTDPPVVKTVSGNPSKLSVFSFRLVAKDPSSPMPDGSIGGVKTIQIIGSGRGNFGTWAYTAEGTYYYSISEVNSGAHGYTYDTSTYIITDSVKLENGQLVVTRIVTNSTYRQVASFGFINTYKGNDGPPSTPAPTKTPTPAPTQAPTPTPVVPTDPAEPTDPGLPPSNPGDTLVPIDDETFIEIDPHGTPVGEWHYENHSWIFDEYPPLNDEPEIQGIINNGPKTGDESQDLQFIILFCTAATTALGSVIYLVMGQRLGYRGQRSGDK